MMRVADGWWKLGGLDHYTTAERRAWRSRAVYWYSLALPDLSGFDRDLAESRIASDKTAQDVKSPPARPGASLPFGIELLANPSCEEDPGQDPSELPGWEVNEGTWCQRGSDVNQRDPEPIGSHFFAPFGICEFAQLVQDVDISAFAGAIDQGDAEVDFTGHIASLPQRPGDQGRITLEFLNRSEQWIYTLESEDIYSKATWRPVRWRQGIPKGTRIIRVWLEATRRGRGAKYNNAYFDELSLTIERAAR